MSIAPWFTPIWEPSVLRPQAARPRSINTRGGPISITTPHRVRTVEQARQVQADYVLAQRAYSKHTPGSQRLDLLDSTLVDPSGRLAVVLDGTLADWNRDPEGDRVDRILLASPRTVSADTPKIADSHLWLLTDLMVPPPDMAVTLHAGDTMRLFAYVSAYRDRHGNKRLGVDEWAPMRTELIYGMKVDGKYGLRRVSPQLVNSLTLCRIGRDGSVSWTDAPVLEEELKRIRPGGAELSSVRSLTGR